MSIDIIDKLNLEQLRERFLKYTRKAFQMLPKMNKPYILDAGCGNGTPTIELARLSDGKVLGIDIDQDALDELKEKTVKLGLTDRIKTENRSRVGLDFQDESFDIIWAEGVMQFIGFERALRVWKRILKINGFMVFHDDLGGKEEKLELIPKYGFKLIGHFQLPDDAWWVEYYEPLQERVKELNKKYRNESKALKALKKYQDEIDMYKKNPMGFRSIYFIMQKITE